jgi:hypothetical protein
MPIHVCVFAGVWSYQSPAQGSERRKRPGRTGSATFSSPPAGASACTESASTSQPSWPVSASESRKSTTAFGSSSLCAMISASSIWSKKPCNPLDNHLGQGCHPCLRCETSPMCPGRTIRSLAGAGGFEPPNGGIKIRCLTTWRRPNGLLRRGGKRRGP